MANEAKEIIARARFDHTWAAAREAGRDPAEIERVWSACRPSYLSQAASILAALASAGLAIVPVEPTEAMGWAGLKADQDRCPDHLAANPARWKMPVWRAMLAAAKGTEETNG